MKKIIALCLVVIICLTFSSCNFSIKAVDTLMRPPKLSGESSLLQFAFEKSLENSDFVIMKNPISGDNRSSFLFYDLDNDNSQEAFAFYSDPTTSEIAYFSIFKKVSGDWVRVANIKGRGEEIYEIDFADLNGDGIFEIIISWTFLTASEKNRSNSFSNESDRVLTIYRYSEKETTLLKTEYFTKIFVDDFNNDRCDEILLLNINLANIENRTTARLLSFNYDYLVDRDITLTLSNMIDIYNVATDNLNGNTRIYIDGLINENTLITEVIDIKHEDFSTNLPLYESNTSEIPSTARGSRIFSFDIDSDGVVEIPTHEVMSNAFNISNNSSELTPLSLTVWSEIKENELLVDFKCLYNVACNYFYAIPETWTNNVSITYNTDSSVLSFYDISAGESEKVEIISFKVFNTNEWNDYNGKYMKFLEDGILVYTYLFNSNSGYNEATLLKNFVIVG